MVDWKRTKSSHVWNNFVLIDREKLKVVIKKAMPEDYNMEVMHDGFSAKSFLQSDGGISGLLSIKMVLEELEESSNSYRSMELMQSLVLCKFCLNCKSTSLQDSILNYTWLPFPVQKHKKNCHSKEHQQLSSNQNDSLLNKKQKTLESSFSMTKQKSMHYDCSNRASTSMSTTLGCQSSTLRRKDSKKCSRIHTHISKKEACLLYFWFVQV